MLSYVLNWHMCSVWNIETLSASSPMCLHWCHQLQTGRQSLVRWSDVGSKSADSSSPAELIEEAMFYMSGEGDFKKGSPSNY